MCNAINVAIHKSIASSLHLKTDAPNAHNPQHQSFPCSYIFTCDQKIRSDQEPHKYDLGWRILVMWFGPLLNSTFPHASDMPSLCGPEILIQKLCWTTFYQSWRSCPSPWNMWPMNGSNFRDLWYLETYAEDYGSCCCISVKSYLMHCITEAEIRIILSPFNIS